MWFRLRQTKPKETKAVWKDSVIIIKGKKRALTALRQEQGNKEPSLMCCSPRPFPARNQTQRGDEIQKTLSKTSTLGWLGFRWGINNQFATQNYFLGHTQLLTRAWTSHINKSQAIEDFSPPTCKSETPAIQMYVFTYPSFLHFLISINFITILGWKANVVIRQPWKQPDCMTGR